MNSPVTPHTAPITAGDIMTRHVTTVTVDCSLQEAIQLMLHNHVSGLPVLDRTGTLTGILTEGDLLRRIELGTEAHRTGWMQFLLGPRRLADDYVETHSRVVGDVMTASVFSVQDASPLSEVVALMQSKHVKRVPVLSGHTLVGIVSRADLLRALANSFVGRPVDHPSDRSIHASVLAELDRQPWAPKGGISVVVTGGCVDLDGVIFEESSRAAIRVVAENVPGVTTVRDHLTWIEPTSGMTFPPPEAAQRPMKAAD